MGCDGCKWLFVSDSCSPCERERGSMLKCRLIIGKAEWTANVSIYPLDAWCVETSASRSGSECRVTCVRACSDDVDSGDLGSGTGNLLCYWG